MFKYSNQNFKFTLRSEASLVIFNVKIMASNFITNSEIF